MDRVAEHGDVGSLWLLQLLLWLLLWTAIGCARRESTSGGDDASSRIHNGIELPLHADDVPGTEADIQEASAGQGSYSDCRRR